MKKTQIAAFFNLILILIFLVFITKRYSTLEGLFEENELKLGLVNTLVWLKHEFLVLVAGALSIYGLIRKSKFLFVITAFFISTQVVALIFAPSVSFLYFTKLIATSAFVWLLFDESVYPILHRSKKALYFFMVMGVYLLFFYLIGI